MGPGLVKLLDLIEANAGDSLLVDRFLVLASDMPDFEKVEASLRLAQKLLGTSPRKAIEVAWMVYKSSLRDGDSLKLIAEGFDRVGKPEKANIVRAEMKRILNMTLPPDVRRLARLTIEEHVTNTLAEKTEPTPKSNLVGEEGPDLAQPVMDRGMIDLGEHKQANASLQGGKDAQPLFALALSLSQLENAGPQKGDPSTEQALDLAQPGLSNVASREHAGHQEVEPIAPRSSVSLPSDGLPAAIPRKEPSKIVIDDQLGVRRDPSNVVTQASVARRGSGDTPEHLSDLDRFKRLEQLANDGSWERLLMMLIDSYPRREHPGLLVFFERHRLEQIDIQFAEYWLDVLISAQQERRAIRYMIQKLTTEPYLAWAKMMLPKIQKITDVMALTPVYWTERDGVLVLRDRLAAQRPVSGCYWAV
jgi:hypothetical protein